MKAKKKLKIPKHSCKNISLWEASNLSDPVWLRQPVRNVGSDLTPQFYASWGLVRKVPMQEKRRCGFWIETVRVGGVDARKVHISVNMGPRRKIALLNEF